QAWSAQEVRTFLDHVASDRLAAAWLLAVSTGMRKGEILGLRWEDVDFDEGRLFVCQTLIAVGYEVRLSEPKTKRSRRQIALDPRAIAALRTHRSQQLAERLGAGPAWMNELGLVFTRENGSPIHPDYFQRAFDR